ncbi:MauE/DoxX family redox-associated membrane protein [Planctomycetota bacterium]
MKLANNILLKALGILLLAAAVLKGWQLMNEPVANNNIWSSRWFLILTVEFELALSIWLLSGLFKKAAWLTSLACFGLFSMITLYKAVTGYASCGCFGSVHVNPWITLFAIDLPAVLALSIFRPGKVLTSRILVRLRLRRRPVKALISEFINPLPSLPRFAVTVFLGATILGVTTPILALNEPATVTTSYEVLEPSQWIGKELPILEHIDITDTLKKGTWLVLLYHYDCPDCGTVIPKYEQMARDLAGNEDFLRIALIAIPPYGPGPVSENSPCKLGRLNETKEWFVTTPAVALLKDGQVTFVWEEKAPDFNQILEFYAKI